MNLKTNKYWQENNCHLYLFLHKIKKHKHAKQVERRGKRKEKRKRKKKNGKDREKKKKLTRSAGNVKPHLKNYQKHEKWRKKCHKNHKVKPPNFHNLCVSLE